MQRIKNLFHEINEEMSVSSAVLITGLLISLSIFFTTLIFFGGSYNRQKLFISSPQQAPQVVRQAAPTPAAPVAPAAPVSPTKPVAPKK